MTSCAEPSRSGRLVGAAMAPRYHSQLQHPRRVRYQQRHGWLGFLFAVVKKFGDDKGGNRTTLLA
jgi:hypothetical protein